MGNGILGRATAEAKGDTLVVKLPMMQILAVIFSAVVVVSGVWITTHDLAIEVARLGESVDRISLAVEHALTLVRDNRSDVLVLEERQRGLSERQDRIIKKVEP